MMNDIAETRKREKSRLPESLFAVGRRVAAVRHALKMKQEEFCLKMGVSTSTLSMIETGKINANVGFVIHLYKDYKVNLDYLFSGAGEMFEQTNFGAGSEQVNVTELESYDDFLWLLNHSPKYRNAMFALATDYFYDHEKEIRENIKITRARRKAKEDL